MSLVYKEQKVRDNSFSIEGSSLWIEINRLEKDMIIELIATITNNLPEIGSDEYIDKILISTSRRFVSSDYAAAILVCRFIRDLIKVSGRLGLPSYKKIVVFPYGKGNKQASAFMCLHLKRLGEKLGVRIEFVCRDVSRIMTITSKSLRYLNDDLADAIWDQLSKTANITGRGKIFKLFGVLKFDIDSI